jgi:hypothetical protein
MKRYCKFNQDIFDADELIWAKDEEYEIKYYDNNCYYFGDTEITNGISKHYENDLYIVIEK